MRSMVHRNNGLAWTRHFGMGGLTPDQWNAEWPIHLESGEWPNPLGNRLTHVGDDDPTAPQTHFYDANGNLVRETTSRHFEWDHSDRMKVYRTQPEGALPSVHAHYLYDAAGQRVMKLVRRRGGRVDVTAYIDGLFEHHRHGQTGSVQENNTLHVMDDQQRIALVRIGSPFPEDTTPAFKFHLGDHLGSSNVVVDGNGVFVNREEYTPYGETSFGSVARKRYRFTGKERDEESGLYYHGARYYAPWLSIWVSPDPVHFARDLNLYQYVEDTPTTYIDPDGESAKSVMDDASNILTVEMVFYTPQRSEKEMRGIRQAVDVWNQQAGQWKYTTRYDGRTYTYVIDFKVRLVVIDKDKSNFEKMKALASQDTTPSEGTIQLVPNATFDASKEPYDDQQPGDTAGRAKGSSIEVPLRNRWLVSTIAHEIGHALGIGRHVIEFEDLDVRDPTNRNEVNEALARHPSRGFLMFPTGSFGRRGTSLRAEDISQIFEDGSGLYTLPEHVMFDERGSLRGQVRPTRLRERRQFRQTVRFQDRQPIVIHGSSRRSDHVE